MPDDLDRKYQIHTVNLTTSCKYSTQAAVMCDKLAKCETCGWNPDVYAVRRIKTREMLKGRKRETWVIGNGTFDKR